VADRRYKGYRIYAYITLSRLFAELNLDLRQPDVVTRAQQALGSLSSRVSKEEVLHAIRSNSHMTEKVLEYLVAEGFVEVRKDERGYDVRITATGVEHLKRYSTFYRELYRKELKDHYRYTGAPSWIGEE
jgi:predicted transcriptional regulator